MTSESCSLKAWPTIEHCCTGSPKCFSKDIQHCWTGGKTLSNIIEWAVQHILEMSYFAGDSKKMSLVWRGKAAVGILILDLLDDDKGSERGKTREWIKKQKEHGMFITMKELKMHDTRGFKEMTRMGPKQFDQILETIEPHICKMYKKMSGDGLIGSLIGFQQLRLAPPSCLLILNHVNS